MYVWGVLNLFWGSGNESKEYLNMKRKEKRKEKRGNNRLRGLLFIILREEKKRS